MMKDKRLYSMIALLAVVGMLFTACQPEVVEVEKEVIVEKVVEVEVTARPDEATPITDFAGSPPVFYTDSWTWPNQADLLAHMSRGKFYIPVQDEGQIAVIDPDAEDYGLHFIKVAYVQPHHPWMAPGMRHVFINFQSEGKGDHDAYGWIDTWTDKITYGQTGINDPFHGAFSPTQTLLLNGDLDKKGGHVHLHNTATLELVASIETSGQRSRDITFSHDGNYAFIGHQGYDPDNGLLGSVDVLDVSAQKIVKSLGEGRCRSGKMSNDGSVVLYSCDKANVIIAIDVEKQEVVKEIELPEGSGPFNIAFRPDDKYAYVGLKKIGKLGIIDIGALELVEALESGTDTNSTYFHPTASLAVVTNDGADSHVSILDSEQNKIIDKIDTGGKSTHNGHWTPDGHWFIVTNRGGDTVTLLEYVEESGTIEWVDDIVVGFGTNGVLWAPYFCGEQILTVANAKNTQNLPSTDTDGKCGELPS